MAREAKRQNCAVCGSPSPSWLRGRVSTQNHGFSTLHKSASGHVSLERSYALVLETHAHNLVSQADEVQPDETQPTAQADEAQTNAGGLSLVEPIAIHPDAEFILHDSCLALLQSALAPEPLPPRRLHDVMASLPYSDRRHTVDWGRGHGMRDVASECGYDPWLALLSTDQEHPQRPYSTFDPLRSPQVEGLLQKAAAGMARRDGGSLVAGADLGLGRVNPSDCFLRLPAELCCIVTEHLSIKDVSSARLASRAFLCSFRNQSFWASRFRRFHERSWLFEALDVKGPLDWRELYRLTRYSCIDKHLKNRRRIWGLVPMIAGTLQLRWHGGVSEAPMRIEHPIGMAVRCQQEPVLDGREGPNVHLIHKCTVPGQLAQIGVSFVTLGDERYVCGFTMWPKDGPPIHLGYESCDQQFVPLDSILGVVAGLSQRGVQAVRFVSSRPTYWVGHPEGLAAARLANGRPVVMLEGGFDVSHSFMKA